MGKQVPANGIAAVFEPACEAEMAENTGLNGYDSIRLAELDLILRNLVLIPKRGEERDPLANRRCWSRSSHILVWVAGKYRSGADLIRTR